MKLIDTTGRSFLAGVTGEVPAGNLVIVDKVNGSDTFGLRGRLERPFATLSAAKAASVAGDTIVVMPGGYTGSDLAKNGVNWHFMRGAIVQAATSSPPIFDVQSTMSFDVTGDGDFLHLDGTANGIVLRANAACTIYFHCQRMESATCCVKVSHGYAYVRVEGYEAYGGELGQVLEVSLSGIVEFNVSSISAASLLSSVHAVLITGGAVTLKSDTVSNAMGCAIKVSGGYLSATIGAIQGESNAQPAVDITGGTATLQARSISAFAFYPVRYDSTTAVLTLLNVLIQSNSANTAHSPIYIAQGSAEVAGTTAAVRLGRCILIAGLATNCISSASDARVTLYGECTADSGMQAIVTRSYSAGPSLLVMAGLKAYS